MVQMPMERVKKFRRGVALLIANQEADYVIADCQRQQQAAGELHETRNQEPILRIQNLQLQRQRCSRLERFFNIEETILFSTCTRLLAAL
jgi:hypothetical protein